MLHFSVPFTHSSSSEDSASPSACPAYVCSLSSRPVVAAAGLGVGALSAVAVAQSTAGMEGLSWQTKETSHSWVLCSGGQAFASERALGAAPGVEDQALCL